MRDTDAAYFAGFVDGEGCITVDRQKRTNAHHKQPFYYIPRMSITNRHKPTLDYLYILSGEVGSFTTRCLSQRNPKWADCYWLGWAGRGIEKFLPDIIPYLKIKRKQADLIMEMIRLKRGMEELAKTPKRSSFTEYTKYYLDKSERYEEIYRAVKKLNVLGPEYSVNNGMNSGEPLTNKTKAILSQAEQACSEGATTIGDDTILSCNTDLSLPPERDDIVCSV